MTKADLIAGLKGKPVEFTTPSGAKVFLRPITGEPRVALEAWRAANEKDPGVNLRLAFRVVAEVLVDESGASFDFTPEEVAELPVIDTDAISREALIRSGMAKREDDPGKALPPATPS